MIDFLIEHKNIIIKIAPIIISILAFFVSFLSYRTSKKTLGITERENMPTLKIIQNLWTENPRYELINESNSKLDSTPSPSYLMFIPSKLYWVSENGEEVSTLILSPFSYELITEQIVGNQTTESIVTSYLPKSFYAKKGERDIIKGKVIHNTEELKLYVNTLPFLVIISDITYQYNHIYSREILLSTPLDNIEITENDLSNVYDYVSDTTNYLEVKLEEEDTNIYQRAHNTVENNIVEIFNKNKPDEERLKILGAKEGGYGNILKKINDLISPIDPIRNHIENK